MKMLYSLFISITDSTILNNKEELPMMRALTIMTAVLAVALLVVFIAPKQSFACDTCWMHNSSGSGDPPKGMKKGEMMHEGMMHGGMMGMTAEELNSAERLFTCPMHPEFVSTDSNANCPICKMQVRAMSGEQVKALRDSHPKGCLMCSMVVPGDSKMTECPMCKMEMHSLEDHDHGKMGGMMKDHGQKSESKPVN